MQPIECVSGGGRPLAYIIRAEFSPQHTEFPTPPELNLQVGLVVYAAGGAVPPHLHLPLARSTVGTAEVLVVKKGRCLLDIYGDDKRLVATRELRVGDVMLMVGGGHGFRMLEDTVLLEVKQGPYTGLEEKERF
jgi:hypothetical protein